MGELDADCRILALQNAISGLKASTCASFQIPRSCSLMRPISSYRRRLDKDEAEAPARSDQDGRDGRCTAIPRLAAIVNHRRHDEAIFERETSNRKWLEKSLPCRFAAPRATDQREPRYREQPTRATQALLRRSQTLCAARLPSCAAIAIRPNLGARACGASGSATLQGGARRAACRASGFFLAAP
jgi:hypothetical protein